MKKVLIAISAVMFLISCGGSSEKVVTDSTVVVDSAAVDTAALTAVDSSVAEIKATTDSTSK